MIFTCHNDISAVYCWTTATRSSWNNGQFVQRADSMRSTVVMLINTCRRNAATRTNWTSIRSDHRDCVHTTNTILNATKQSLIMLTTALNWIRSPPWEFSFFKHPLFILFHADVSPTSHDIRSRATITSGCSVNINYTADGGNKIASTRVPISSPKFQDQSQRVLDRTVDECRSVSKSRDASIMQHRCGQAHSPYTHVTSRDTFADQQADSCVQCRGHQRCSNRSCVHNNGQITGCINTGTDSDDDIVEPAHRDGRLSDVLKTAERARCSQNGSEGSDVVMFGTGNTSEAFGSYRKKTRTVFSSGQVGRLETMFDMKHYLSSTERSRLAAELRLTDTQVKIWFQNRRNKWKRQLIQNEVGTNDTTGAKVVNLAAATDGGEVSRERSKSSGVTEAAERVLSFCSPFYYIGMVPPSSSLRGFQWLKK